MSRASAPLAWIGACAIAAACSAEAPDPAGGGGVVAAVGADVGAGVGADDASALDAEAGPAPSPEASPQESGPPGKCIMGAATCTPGCRQCVAPNTLQVCSSANTWQNYAACPVACCQTPALTGPGDCVNTQSDRNNCGACGNVCAAGTDCCNGACISNTSNLDCGGGCNVCPEQQMCCSGACVSAVSNTNCGACGNTCCGAAGACSVGTCGVSTLVSGLNQPYGVAVNGSDLYFAAFVTGIIGQVATTGGAVTTLASTSTPNYGFFAKQVVADATNVYWTNGAGNGPPSPPAAAQTVMKCAVANCAGTAVTLGSSQNNAYGIALNPAGTKVYWEDDGSKNIMQNAVSGGSLTTIAAAVSQAYHGIAVDSSNVYWAGGGSGAGIVSMAPVTSPFTVSTIASGRSNLWFLTSDGTYVYWTEFTNPGNVMRALIAPPNTLATLSSTNNNPGALAKDSTDVYFGDNGDCYVGRVPATPGGVITTLATGQVPREGIAVDSSCVYWSNCGNYTGNCGTSTCGSGGSVATVNKTPSPATVTCAGVSGINLASDANNCGYCGHTCLGGACTSGACQPITLASAVNAPTGLAVDSTSAYFGTTPGVGSPLVGKVAVGGGAVTTLVASAPANVFWDAVDSTNVYFIGNSSAAGGVYKTAIAGGGVVTTIASATGGAAYGAFDGTNVYWDILVTKSPFGSVQETWTGGGTTFTLATGQDTAGEMAVDSTNVYWATAGKANAVVKTPILGGAVTTLSSSETGAQGVALDPAKANVYYTLFVASGSVKKIPVGGGAVTTLTSAANYPAAIAVDATTAYWLDTHNASAAAGAVLFLPVGGGTPQTLASGLTIDQYAQIALDSNSVYWTDHQNPGTVKRIAKP